MRSLPGTAISSALGALGRTAEAFAERLGDVARVLNFTSGSLGFQARPDDIFIVTYPRSGTTLMQFALHLLAGDGRDDFDHISQVVPWFERSLANGAITADELEAMPSPRIFKSHLAHCWVPKGGRYIYITRAGQDVAVSYYHFYRSHLRFGGSFERFFRRFLRGELQYKSWFKHTAGWHAHRGDPRILFLEFEDLVHSLPSCLDEIVRFCELEPPPGRIDQVLRMCSFDYMKQHEQKFDFTTELLLQRGYRLSSFLRSGKTGEGRRVLSREQEEAFARVSEKAARRAGLELDLPEFLR